MGGPTHLVAVDGGGSGCRVALADLNGRVLAQASGGPANLSSDPDGALRHIGLAVQQAMGGIDPGRVVAHMGLAGVLNAGMADRVAGAFGFARCSVGDDRETSLIGALGDRDGLLFSLGTGSIMAGRSGGTVRHVSGWGLQVSDQASGAWLGRALLERVLLCHDGMFPHSTLSDTVLHDMGGPVGIVGFAATARAADYAALAPRIVAAQGDSTATALMTAGACFIERTLAVLDPGRAGVICLAGGVGPHYAPWLSPGAKARLTAPLGSALDGALTLAHRAATGATG